MIDQYLTGIDILGLPNIGTLPINLSSDQKKHLIITGRNGSGKTTFLNALRNFVGDILGPQGVMYFTALKALRNTTITAANNHLIQNETDQKQRFINRYKIFATFSSPGTASNAINNRNFLFTTFEAKRITAFAKPKSISVLELRPRLAQNPNLREVFLQYIVNKKAEQSFARDDNDTLSVQQIEKWFSTFLHQLKVLFEDETLQLIFDRKSFNFSIKLKDKAAFDFNQMSDGYAAVFTVVTEIILRMEANDRPEFDLPGIILIDEIETHLHVDLQKKILPFLTAFFPNLQFIVTTHSPFVITSLNNSVICDLENKIVVNDLSAYSYDAIIESYYNSDKYSEQLKINLERYEKLLINKASLSETENTELLELSRYFDGIPKHLAKELQAKLVQLELDYSR